MADDLIATTSTVLETGHGVRNVPTLVVQAGGDAQKRFIEFFAAQIRNRNTREAYIRDVVDFFDWVEEAEIGDLLDIEPIHVAAWAELKTQVYEPQMSSSSSPRCGTCLTGWSRAMSCTPIPRPLCEVQSSRTPREKPRF